MTGVTAAPAGQSGAVRQGATIASAMFALAIAVWLVPASVHITGWPRSGVQRVAVFAPLYWLWAALAAAALATGIGWVATRRVPRQREHLAWTIAPLQLLWIWTVPYWPYVPDRWPLLLAGAGSLRWVVAACAVAGVVVRWLRGLEAIETRRPWMVFAWPRRRAAFLGALVLYTCLGVRAVTTTGLGGDEPHYLVITHSLLADGDLQIENNHARGDYRAFFNGDLRPDYLQRGTNGEIYSIHAPGLSVLLLPGYALARGLGAVLTMCLLSALTMLAVFDVAVATAGIAVGWLVWLAVGVTVPFVPHAWALYPEMAGAAVVAWTVAWLVRDEPASAGVWAWVWRGVCLAWLPWLHTKFSVFLAGLMLLVAWQLRRQWRPLLACLVPVAVGGVAWLAFFYAIYGTVDPQAPYGTYTAQFVRFANLPRSLLGLFVDQKFGLLVYAPIYALTLAGAWELRHDPRARVIGVGGVVLAAAYVASSARLYMWWGGSSAPARFLVPVAPLLVPALAAGMRRQRGLVATTTWTMAGGISLLIGLGGALGAGRFVLFSNPHGTARLLELLQGSAPLTAALPTFTEENWRAPMPLLVPWVVALLVALAAGRWRARHTTSAIEIGATLTLVFAGVAAALAPNYSAPVRAEARTRGGLALLERFDPVRARAFDYARLRRLTAQDWLAVLSVSVDHQPGSEPDPIGRVSGALVLPPGVFETRVWFEGDRPRDGALQAALGNGYVLARVDGPLANPAVLRMAAPVAVPALWIQLTDLASARSVRRVDVVAVDVQPASQRSRDPVVAVEAFPDRLGAYVAFLNEDAYPERGVFWTRADATARLQVVPAGASTLVMTIHVGPAGATVTVQVGDQRESLNMARDETRVVRITLPAGATAVPITVRSDAFFRPAEVDPSSTDTRELGSQVRLVLE